jgi:hypothetical protein
MNSDTTPPPSLDNLEKQNQKLFNEIKWKELSSWATTVMQKSKNTKEVGGGDGCL